LVAYIDPPHIEAEFASVAAACGFEFVFGFAAQEVADPAMKVRRMTGDAQKPFAIAVAFGPHCPTRSPAMRDSMRLPAQWHDDAVGEGCCLR
jgi:hypothetical protein